MSKIDLVESDDPKEGGYLKGIYDAALIFDPELATVIDDQGAGTVYVATAPKGSSTSSAVWRVSRLVTASGRTTKTWATALGACNSTAVLAALTYA